jgi:hypothetical protein
MFTSALSLAAAANPAGGAELSQVAIATAGALILTAGLLTIALGHRTGRLAWVGRLAAHSERISGLPGWVAIPAATVGGALLLAVFGMYWDISYHLDDGRDPGPLANPAHYAILLGLFGVLAAAVLAIALPLRRPGAAALRLAPGWEVPLGGVLLFLCAAFALTGFPLDDVWHRLFGQDVTLWGPTHLMLIGGASLATLAMLVLVAEGAATRGTATLTKGQRVRFSLQRAGLAGGFLVALSTFQAEFDFGIPQFRLLFHPLLLMLAAGVGLLVARIHLGRGGALLAVGGFLAIRGGLAVLVGPVLGHTTPHFPLYLVEALVVEAVAARLGRDRPLLLGVVSGLGIGTVGLAAEWGWSHVWAVNPWPAAMLPETVIVGVLAALAAGTLGGWVGAAITPGLAPVRPPSGRAALGALAVLMALIAWTLPISSGPDVRARVTASDLAGGSKRTVALTVRLDPPTAADGAEWLDVTAWQGGGSVVDHLQRVAPGVYRTTQPIPVHGDWKTTLRLHKGNAVQGLAVYFPADPAIPAEAVPAPASFDRAFVTDKQLLQREQKTGVAPWLTLVAYLVVLGIALTVLAVLGWGLQRANRRLGAGIRDGDAGAPARATVTA